MSIESGKSEQRTRAKYNELMAELMEMNDQMVEVVKDNIFFKKKAALLEDASRELNTLEQFMYSHLASCSGVDVDALRLEVTNPVDDPFYNMVQVAIMQLRDGCNAHSDLSTSMRMLSIEPTCKSVELIQDEYNEMRVLFTKMRSQLTHLMEEGIFLDKVSALWEIFSRKLNVIVEFVDSHLDSCLGAAQASHIKRWISETFRRMKV